jgi:hypothetical protein
MGLRCRGKIMVGRQTWAAGGVALGVVLAGAVVLASAQASSADTVTGTVPAVSGVLTDTRTGTPVAGACVEVIDNVGADRVTVATGCAGSDGRYTTRGDIPAGTWLVRAYQESGQHAPVVSAPIQLSAGSTAVDVDLAMPAAATLTGRVVDGRTGAPIFGACPYAYLGRTGTMPYLQAATCSDSEGRWSLTGLPAGRLSVQLSGGADHIGRWAPGVDKQSGATTFVAAEGRTTSTGTTTELRGATLAGRITDAAGHPVPGAWVVIGDDHAMRMGAGFGEYVARTDATGQYSISNIPPQRRSVLVEPDEASGLAWQWSGAAADPATASPLTFRYEKTARFDAVLTPEAVLSVRLAPGSTGSALVDVQTLGGAYVGLHSEVSSFAWGTGTVLVHGLPAGKVVLQLTPETGTPYWYDHAASRSAATTIPLTAGRTTSITVALP